MCIYWYSDIIWFCLLLDEPVISRIVENRLSAQDFKLIQVIGRGAFGEVQLVRMIESKKVYAMKILNKFEMVSQCVINTCR